MSIVCSRGTPTMSISPRNRLRAKREHLKIFYGLLPESQGQNLAFTVLYVLDLLGLDGCDLPQVGRRRLPPQDLSLSLSLSLPLSLPPSLSLTLSLALSLSLSLLLSLSFFLSFSLSLSRSRSPFPAFVPGEIQAIKSPAGLWWGRWG